MLPAEQHLITVGAGVSVGVTDGGPPVGLPVVVLGPEPFGVDAWGVVLDRLRQRARILAVDVRARGRSPAIQVGHSIGQYAEDLAEVLAACGIARFLGVGWSLGVSVLWEYTRRHAGMEGLLAVDQPAVRDLRPGELDHRLHRIRTDRRAHHQAVVEGYVGPDLPVPPAVVEGLVSAAMAVPMDAHAEIVATSYTADYRPVVSALAVPMVVCWGDHGTLDGPTAERLAAATPGGSAVHFPGTGHLMPIQSPDRMEDVLDRFIAEMNGGTVSASSAR